MSLPLEVLNDLLPVYLSGEASAATRQLVEARASEDPEFASALRAAAGLALPEPPLAPGREAELDALRRTRQFVRLRSIFMGAGIFFTLAPFSFHVGAGGFEWFVIGRSDGVAVAMVLLAIGSWTVCWLMNREVGKAGL